MSIKEHSIFNYTLGGFIAYFLCMIVKLFMALKLPLGLKYQLILKKIK